MIDTKSTTVWHIAYDIADPRRLRRVERALSAVGERQHYSLFMCEITAAELAALQGKLARLIEPLDDIVRYTPLCPRDALRTRHLGTSTTPEQADAWIV